MKGKISRSIILVINDNKKATYAKIMNKFYVNNWVVEK